MKRLLALFVTAGLAIGLLLVGSGAAGAAKYDNCDLLTKKQASKILGYKVVETRLTKDKATGAEECEFRTNHYFGDTFKSIKAPYKLQVTTQPLTGEVKSTIATLQADTDSTPVTELGADVFFSAQEQLVAVVGPIALQIDVANYTTEGGSKDAIVYAPPIAAAKLLIPLFEDAAKK